MFTGIIKGKGCVEGIIDKPNLRSLSVTLPAGSEIGLEHGASVAVDGVCLTVSDINGHRVSFDVMAETLERTTIGALKQSDWVNIERAARDGAEIGGHPLSGHIDCTCRVARIERPENSVVMTFDVPSPFIRYVFSKGYIGLNGTSLTVSGVDKKSGTFQVWFIPETLKITTFGEKQEGDLINLEVERGTQVVVDTVTEFLEERFSLLLPKLMPLLDDL